MSPIDTAGARLKNNLSEKEFIMQNFKINRGIQRNLLFIICLLAGLAIIVLLSSCSKTNEDKYTIADRRFISELIEISSNNSRMLYELAVELKKYPKMDYERIFNKIQLLLNNIDNGKNIIKPNYFLDVYSMWGNTLDDMKESLLLLDKGLEKHNSGYISEAGTKMVSVAKKMNDMALKMKGHLEEAKNYEKNNK